MYDIGKMQIMLAILEEHTKALSDRAIDFRRTYYRWLPRQIQVQYLPIANDCTLAKRYVVQLRETLESAIAEHEAELKEAE